MNLRIEEQCFRFRISKEELKKLLAGEALKQKSILSESSILIINIISKTQTDILSLVFVNNHMTLSVQKAAIEDLYNTLPSREGIQSSQDVRNEQALQLILEVDIRTQKRRK